MGHDGCVCGRGSQMPTPGTGAPSLSSGLVTCGARKDPQRYPTAGKMRAECSPTPETLAHSELQTVAGTVGCGGVGVWGLCSA